MKIAVGTLALLLLAATEPMRLTSPVLHDGAPVPARFTCDGADVSPPLAWRDVPAGTRSFALVIEDPDAPRGTFRHWAIYDIPASAHGLPEGVKPDALGVRQTKNDGGSVGYRGPCPPPGKIHHYHFRLFALPVDHLAVAPGADVKAVADAAHVRALAEADLTPIYSR